MADNPREVKIEPTSLVQHASRGDLTERSEKDQLRIEEQPLDMETGEAINPVTNTVDEVPLSEQGDVRHL